MTKKYLLIGAIAAPLLCFNNAKSFEFPEKPPVGELSANVSYYTNYIWRGEEQTGGIAIQGGFDYSVNLIETYISIWDNGHIFFYQIQIFAQAGVRSMAWYHLDSNRSLT